jgi:hypothetical protein
LSRLDTRFRSIGHCHAGRFRMSRSGVLIFFSFYFKLQSTTPSSVRQTNCCVSRNACLGVLLSCVKAESGPDARYQNFNWEIRVSGGLTSNRPLCFAVQLAGRSVREYDPIKARSSRLTAVGHRQQTRMAVDGEYVCSFSYQLWIDSCFIGRRGRCLFGGVRCTMYG